MAEDLLVNYDDVHEDHACEGSPHHADESGSPDPLQMVRRFTTVVVCVVGDLKTLVAVHFTI